MDERLHTLACGSPGLLPADVPAITSPIKAARMGGGTSYFTNWTVVGEPGEQTVEFSVDATLLIRTFRLAFSVVSAYVVGEHGGGCLWWKDLAAQLERDYGLVYTDDELKDMQIANAFRVASVLEDVTNERTGREVPVYVHYATPTRTGLEVEYLGGCFNGYRY
jgi:hypothetical protein